MAVNQVSGGTPHHQQFVKTDASDKLNFQDLRNSHIFLGKCEWATPPAREFILTTLVTCQLGLLYSNLINNWRAVVGYVERK